MIRTLTALAALAAIPTIASAQGFYDQNSNSVTVYGQRPDSYQIIIPTAGKAPDQVRDEIFSASYLACERAPLTANRADYTTDSMRACVNAAETGAMQQYDRILHGQ